MGKFISMADVEDLHAARPGRAIQTRAGKIAYLKTIRGLISEYNKQSKALGSLKSKLAEAEQGHSYLLENGGDGDAREVARLSGLIEILPGQISDCESTAKGTLAQVFVAAVKALDTLDEFLARQDSETLAAAMKAVHPFCRDNVEAQAVAESCSKVRTANQVKSRLLAELDRRDTVAINKIAALLESAGGKTRK
jgi:hypothetical protein